LQIIVSGTLNEPAIIPAATAAAPIVSRYPLPPADVTTDTSRVADEAPLTRRAGRPYRVGIPYPGGDIQPGFANGAQRHIATRFRTGPWPVTNTTSQGWRF